VADRKRELLTIVVRTCDECPWLHYGSGDHWCTLLGAAGAPRLRLVDDQTTRPRWCPLRKLDVKVCDG
jgi:hypothetical protein